MQGLNQFIHMQYYVITYNEFAESIYPKKETQFTCLSIKEVGRVQLRKISET